jgi:pimeloyl-ACP methyl ester carboxylesterase
MRRCLVTRATREVVLPGGLTAVAAGPARSDATSVLLVHGMMGGAWQFGRLQLTLTARGYRNLALNYRGHHDSFPIGMSVEADETRHRSALSLDRRG